MANRIVEWVIRANYKQPRRESDSLGDSLKRLARRREELNKSQIEGDKRADESLRKRHKAEREEVKLHRAMQQATDKTTSATDLSTKATARHVKTTRDDTSAITALTGALKSHAVQRRAAAAATAQHNREMEANRRYGAEIQRNELSATSATLALAAAKERLAKAEAAHGKSSNQYAQALNTVRRKENDVEIASGRLAASHAKLGSATRQVDRDHNTLGRTLSRFSGWVFRADRTTGQWFKTMAKGTFTVIKFGAVLTALPAAVSGLVQWVSQLSAGLVSLIGPTARLTGVLAALPGAFAAAAGGIGTFFASFVGMGEAIKAGFAAQKDAAKGATALGKAQRNSGRQIAAANQQVKDSEYALKQAQQAARDAQKNLTEARKQARMDIEQLRQSLRDLELQERGAALSVEEAQQRLQEVMLDPNATSLQKREAQLALDEAMNSLDTVRKENAKAQKDMAAANKKGIEGSDAVVQAHRQEADAQHGVVQAQQAIIDAKQGVIDANESAAETMASASAEATKYKEALDELSPAQQKFVKLIIGLKDEGKKLRDAAASGLLPGLGSALQRMTKLTPLVARGFHETGKAIGDASVAGSKMLTSGPFTQMFSRILKSNVQLTKDAGEGTNNLIRAMVNVADAARPFTEWLSSVVVGWTEYIAGAAEAGNKTGALQAWLMGPAKNALTTFGHTLRNLWDTFKGLARAGGSLGTDLTTSFEDITAKWAEWTNSLEGQNSLKLWFDGARGSLHETAVMLGGLMRMIYRLGQGAPKPPTAVKPLGGAAPASGKPRMAPGGEQLPTAEIPVRVTGAESALKEINDRLGPSIERLLTIFKDNNVLADFVDIIANLVDALSALAKGGGGFDAFVGTLKKFSELIKGLAELPGANMLLKILGALAAARFAAGFLGAITGFSKFLKRRQVMEVYVNVTGPGAALVTGSPGMAPMGGLPGRHKGGPVKARPKKTMRQRVTSKMGNFFGRTAPQYPGVNAGPGVMGSGRGGPSDVGAMGSKFQTTARKISGTTTALGLFIGALSFMPGPIGDALGPLSSILSIFGGLTYAAELLAPGLAGKLGGAFLKLGGFVKTAAVALASGLATMAKVVARGVMAMTRVLMANPWMLLIAALIVVVVLVVKYWDQIKAFVTGAISWIVNWVKSHWDILKWFLGPIALIVTQMVKHWDAIKSGIKGALTGILDMVKTVWGKLGDIVKAPLKFVVSLINNGLIAPFNAIAGALGFKGKNKQGLIPKITWFEDKASGSGNFGDPRHVAARGAVIPGYTPGRDVTTAAVSGGEAIMRPEWTRVIGKRRVDEMNRLARRGPSALKRAMQRGFALGGVVSPTPAGYPWNWDWNDAARPGVSFAYDIPVPTGTRIRADRSGVVARVADEGNRSYGRWIQLNGANGGSSIFAHLLRSLVSPGQKVSAGQVIGISDNTGGSTGPHLHYEGRLGAAAIVPGTSGAAGGGHWWDGAVHWVKNAIGNVKGFITGLADKMNLGKIAEKFGDSPLVKIATAVPRMLLGKARSWLFGKKDDPDGKPAGDDSPEGYAKGGVVGGIGKRDVVPAMLTPGEFVLNRKAVSRIGLGRLRALNGRRRSGVDENGNRLLAGGGMVRAGTFNVHSTTSDAQTRADLRRLLPRVDTLSLQEWYGGKMDLVPWLHKQGWGFYKGPTGTAIAWRRARFAASNLGSYDLNTHYRMPAGTSQRYATYGLMTDKQTGQKFWQTSVHFIPPAAYYHGRVTKRRRDAIFHEQVARLNALVAQLRGTAPVIVGGDFNSTSQRLLDGLASGSHSVDQVYSALANADVSRVGNLASDHDATISQISLGQLAAQQGVADPTPVQDALYAAQAANQAMAAFTGYLTTIASWGLTDLLDKLLEMGVDEGYNIAQSAVSDRATASLLNDEYRKAALYSGDDLANFVKMIAFLTNNPGIGLRALSRGLSLSDLATVLLVEKSFANGKIPSTLNTTALRADIASYRAGTLYRARGGIVPGSGAGDTVPAMLTPGEFVIQRRAAKALGLSNLLALNGFAEGGPVLSPKVAGLPGVLNGALSAAGLARSSAGIINYGDIYDVDIHNPVRETSTYSLMKALQRRSAMNGVMTSPGPGSEN